MDEPLLQAVQEAVAKKRFLKIQYVTDLHEHLTVTSIIKRLEEKDGELVLELVTGQELKFAQLVKLGDTPSTNYNSIDFTCDC